MVCASTKDGAAVKTSKRRVAAGASARSSFAGSFGVFEDNRSAVDLSSADANDLRRFSMRLGIKY